jgi:hypothetical protein
MALSLAPPGPSDLPPSAGIGAGQGELTTDSEPHLNILPGVGEAVDRSRGPPRKAPHQSATILTIDPAFPEW